MQQERQPGLPLPDLGPCHRPLRQVLQEVLSAEQLGSPPQFRHFLLGCRSRRNFDVLLCIGAAIHVTPSLDHASIQFDRAASLKFSPQIVPELQVILRRFKMSYAVTSLIRLTNALLRR